MSFGRTETAIAIGIAIVVLIIGIAAFGMSGNADKRAEVERFVTSIREAELAHFEKFDEYIGTDWVPRPRFEVNDEAVSWPEEGAFSHLGWTPTDRDVFGTYRVTVTGDDFTVTGVSDVDNDGQQAVFVATRDSETVRQTAENVY